MFSREVVWENKETFGCECLKTFTIENMIHVVSTVIYMNQNAPIQVDYQIELDSSWNTKRLSIHNGRKDDLHITSNGKGEWFDQYGSKIDELNGAIDVDISATPFSNSLPINRFDWEPNQKRSFEMVYISVPSLKFQKVKQTYTYIEGKGNIQIFNYSSRDFETRISVDEKGLVIDYPKLFTRRY
ncbi:putative glycolipid-binding domain-containing protein [Paenisporosarcina sp. TG20]|uniref:putative glycolipid-binding domain-containing protein n=1 Tax=Paenisporosarcina sp. TG20 TaxID=1211706 RepID=UPI000307FC8C|nr:putative glycolipid-binding domain-containing protein [Paenisporosarcina sp. TG20]